MPRRVFQEGNSGLFGSTGSMILDPTSVLFGVTVCYVCGCVLLAIISHTIIMMNYELIISILMKHVASVTFL